jgi:hypothetical protein
VAAATTLNACSLGEWGTPAAPGRPWSNGGASNTLLAYSSAR